MAEKSTPKGAKAKMKRIHVAVEEALHTEVRVQAALAKTTLKGFVIEAIKRAVAKGEGKK